MSKFRLRMKQAKVLFLLSCFRLVKFFFKDIWVICERGDDARDNAYWLYKYIKKNNPEQRIYYIIDFDSVDYPKVAEDAVQIGSIKYFWALAVSDKIISTHYGAGLKYFTQKFFRYSGLGKKFYFLQHGVIKDEMPQLHGENAPMQLFVCGAKPEYDWIVQNFNHQDKVVKYTGLARFDQLHSFISKKQILVMPTWRTYIKSKKQFLSSEYYNAWQSFLINPELIQSLQQEDIMLYFYPHYETQQYISCFRSISKNVVIANFDHYDVQTLLKESAVLITDYSSVFFDFAYMRKPIIYYQFDETRFFGNHYQRGYFDYREMGFGDVCLRENEVLESLKKQICNNMQIEKKYLDRVETFFPLYDEKNSERIYNLIAGIEDEKQSNI